MLLTSEPSLWPVCVDVSTRVCALAPVEVRGQYLSLLLAFCLIFFESLFEPGTHRFG